MSKIFTSVGFYTKTRIHVFCDNYITRAIFTPLLYLIIRFISENSKTNKTQQKISNLFEKLWFTLLLVISKKLYSQNTMSLCNLIQLSVLS